MDTVGRAVAASMATTAETMAARAASEISTPYPPASAPGQPPHRRSGKLAAAVAEGHTVTRDGDDVIAKVGIATGGLDYAPIVAASRPWMTDAVVGGVAGEIVDTVAGDITAAL